MIKYLRSPKYYKSREWLIKIRKLKKTPKYSKNKSWKGTGKLSGNLFYCIKYGAKNRGIPFKITIFDAWNQFIKQNGRCFYSGQKLRIRSESRKQWKITASLDRKNSKFGYTRRNICWATKRINKMKGTLRNQDFVRICQKIANHV